MAQNLGAGRVKKDIDTVVEHINIKLGSDMYSVEASMVNATVSANSGPDTVEYIVQDGTIHEALVYLHGVESGINSAKLIEMLDKTDEKEETKFPYYWHDPADMTSAPCRVSIWPPTECLEEDGIEYDIRGYVEETIFYIQTDVDGEAEVFQNELSYIEDVDEDEFDRACCTQCGCLMTDEGECQQGCEQGERVTIEDAEHALKEITTRLCIDMPLNKDEIAEFMREDVASAADTMMWHSGDFDIAFRRYLERDVKGGQ